LAALFPSLDFETRSEPLRTAAPIVRAVLDYSIERNTMKSPIVLTGATGYIGSHLAAELLAESSAPIICMARRRGAQPARERVEAAILQAWHDQGRAPIPHGFARLHVFEEDFHEPQSLLSDAQHYAIRKLQPGEFWHCAASVRFTEKDDGSVWTTNVEGVSRALRLAAAMGVRVFNHVSTAYVAGSRTGLAHEELSDLSHGFHNVYEQSKSHGEWLVVGHCRDFGLDYRILRPSIVVGHSVTHRTSSDSGVFRVAELSRKFYQMVESRSPGYFDNNPLRVRVDPQANFNAIPIDCVVAEMLALRAAGTASLNRIYHHTSITPHNSLEALEILLSMSGIDRVERVADPRDLGMIDKLFEKGLKAYGPYINGRLHFDRSNVNRFGADAYQNTCRQDIAALRRTTAHFFADLERTAEQQLCRA
jgi:thioester reductase-like protein